MEGQRNLEMSLNIGGNANYVSCRPEDDPNWHFVMGAGRSGNQPNALSSSPQWTTQLQEAPLNYVEAPLNYVEFLAENSTFLENASGADMLETITSTVGGMQSVEGLSEIQKEFLFNNPGKVCGYRPADASVDMNVWQNPHNEVKPANRFTNFQAQQQVISQNHTLWKEPYEDNGNMSQLPPRVTVAPSFFLPKQHHNVSRQRAAVTDRVRGNLFSTTGNTNGAILKQNRPTKMHRRMRIAEKLRSLQELLPHSTEGSQAAILDDIIDHIKFLQLQIKELSQSILGGQSTSRPFIFLEGYGHYVISEQMTNESLEEMMGKLLETNPAAAIKLLERKGLYMMPMSLANELGQPSKMLGLPIY